MISIQNKISIALLLVVHFGFAQEKDKTIGSQTVNVVKPYTPTISDAYKIKDNPPLEDEGNKAKETINYNIFSFPVASTFTPSKGKAEGVEKAKRERTFGNYATLGVGNYGTLIGELFVTQDLGNNDYVAGMFRHHSSQGGIKEVELNDEFYDTSLNLAYGMNDRYMSWNVEAGYQNQIYNWYGLPEGFGSTLSLDDREMLLESISPKHVYNTITLGGNIAFSESVFEKVNVNYTRFMDGFDSAENRFYVKPSFKVNIMDFDIKTDVIVDYVGGNFKNNYQQTNVTDIKYGFTNFGIVPSFVLNEDDWTLKLGAGLFYSMDNEGSRNKFFVYPQVNASYKIVNDLMIFYAGAQGTLNQNSYANLVSQNPFLSPTLLIEPTSNLYDAFVGLKGKLANNISYNISGSYLSENNKALFKSNNFTENSANQDYAFGNSFGVVYDDISTTRFYAELKADFSENVTFGINGTFNSYKTDEQQEAWNLPTMQLSSTLDVQITPKWFAGFNIFYVGERKDLQINSDLATFINYAPITLESYFDANAHVGYKHSERLTAFLRFNNIANQNYEKWLNYPVQGFQVVVGANYKFDF
ncbi:TonB-dependent receptor [Flavobacterium agrisoli]|uniref:TonB-dependent receptor n=1 Tax=Flavobacterium agrisoli TaxID=2793066 RepID=A0A934UID8_9FLAO|nr:TonB-dependent receptor [Flavobacterium agrisoli]MBK0368746.1 TonB-dependent receptor [Flavobacterium agrisoli]